MSPAPRIRCGNTCCRLARQATSSGRTNLATKKWHPKTVIEEKDDDIDRLRRMFAEVHERREKPSRLKKVMMRLRAGKIRNGITKPKKKNDAA